MINLLSIPVMACLARAAGGGLFAVPLVYWAGTRYGAKAGSLASKVPEIIFALRMAVPAFYFGPLLYLPAAVWAFAWMETGHGTAYTMGRLPETAQSGRKQTLSAVIDPLCEAVGAPLGGRFYCWAFMALKGALIGLTAGPDGLWLAFLWPASYEAGWLLTDRFPALRRRFEATELGEWFSGGSAGLVLAL